MVLTVSNSGSLGTWVVLLLLASGVQGSCPYIDGHGQQEGISSPHESRLLQDKIFSRRGGGSVPTGGFQAVQNDLEILMTQSKRFWPADFEPPIGPHYGGLFIRLAWHCAGSYREHDGRGGCDGGRIRFEPELTWPDNANLNKALYLLRPIKQKFGASLSWGDLIILSGNAAIASMGGPLIGFCGGRIDDADGSDSLKLGPSAEQEEIGPCQTIGKQGVCLSVNGTALGPTTVGLIYVNPGGPLGQEGNATASGIDISTAFGRMGFNESETVALIGGGHAFGKMHGACPNPPCGTGKGLETVTSGYEGSWTTTPTSWSNEYFKSLFDFTWVDVIGPGGKLQFSPLNSDGTNGPNIAMLTTDIAMTTGVYKSISEKYSTDLSALENDFAHAWYRLTTADMGPATRCIGELVPPPQEFQSPLPMRPSTLPDYIPIRGMIEKIIKTNPNSKLPFINLAYRCAATFQKTNFKGGCNGARIRFEPESTWRSKKGTKKALEMLEPVKKQYASISYSDLIVLAGVTALEHKSTLELAFCGGRVDADNAINSDPLKPRYYEPAVVQVRDDFQVKGLTNHEGVALAARRRVSKKYFLRLLEATASSTLFSREELAMKEEEFLPIVVEFSENEHALHAAFKSGWTKLMTADRFSSNYGNECTGVDTPTKVD